jgi:hypothetical protein
MSLGLNLLLALLTFFERFNHDCRPNAYYHFNPHTLRHTVIAATAIMPGEEITVSYLPQLQSSQDRQTQLKRSWGFRCDCSLCSASAAILAASDYRVNEINRLTAELRRTETRKEAMPEGAELLVSLYKQERIWGPINEAYTLAALEWSSVGNEYHTRRSAELALHAGVIYRGEHHWEVQEIKELLADMGSHWSWRWRANATTEAGGNEIGGFGVFHNHADSKNMREIT